MPSQRAQHFVTPVSAAGRLYTAIFTFVCLGLVASYTANLATVRRRARGPSGQAGGRVRGPSVLASAPRLSVMR